MRSGSSKVMKCNFLKSEFMTCYAQKKLFKHQGSPKSGKGHPRSSSAIFHHFWPLVHRKGILDIREGQNKVKVIKCNFSKSVFMTSHAQKKHFRHLGSPKSDRSHPMSSSAIFQKIYFGPPMHSKSILDIRDGQNKVKVIQGHQVQVFKKYICTEKSILDTREGQHCE